MVDIDESFTAYEAQVKAKGEKLREAFIDIEPIRKPIPKREPKPLSVTKPKPVKDYDPNLSLF